MTRKKVDVQYRKKSAALVEYTDSDIPVRVSVPSAEVEVDALQQTFIDEDVLESGIPYGVPFASKIGDFVITGETIENELHKAGVWTTDDFASNPQKVHGAVASAARPIMQALAILIKDYTHNKEV